MLLDDLRHTLRLDLALECAVGVDHNVGACFQFIRNKSLSRIV